MKFIYVQVQEKVITMKIIERTADGRIREQTAGNGVTERYEYDPQSLRLTRHLITYPSGKRVISDLHYRYDPAGNILSIEDKCVEPIWHANHQVVGQRRYIYDTLYRLVSATGREQLPAARWRGPFPRALADSTAGVAWSPYIQIYRYDEGNNLTETFHRGRTSRWKRQMIISARSNRGVQAGSQAFVDPHDAYSPGGLRRWMDDGRELEWHADGQLSRVSLVQRATKGTASDTETYRYAKPGIRTRKIYTARTSGGERTTVTTYAGGCETSVRRLSTGTVPQLNIRTTEAEGMRLTENRLTGEMYLYYSFSDHLGSISGETDARGNLISREEYYPFGGSAGMHDREQSEVSKRRRRYSGKERDATGLYYYGFRYYQSESARWLSADPGGVIDGVNLYRFSRNNPLRFRDSNGLYPDTHGIHDKWNENGDGYLASERIMSVLNGRKANDDEMDKEIEHIYNGTPDPDATDSDDESSPKNPFKILSQYKNGIAAGWYRFENEFKAGRWRLIENYRASETKQGELTKAYASTIVIEQYRKVAKAQGFYGQLPKVILRWDVVNSATNALTQRLDGDPTDPEQLEKVIRQRFLTETVNGKHTQRILDQLDLEATKVVRHSAYYDKKKGQDITVYAVHVRPCVDRATLRQALERSLDHHNRNVFSRAFHSATRQIIKCIRPATAN